MSTVRSDDNATCEHWNCLERISPEYEVCNQHYWALPKMDRCPQCGYYKAKRLRICPNCSNGESPKGVAPHLRKSTAFSKQWSDPETTVFFVYIMEFDGDDGRVEYYVGQTNDVRARKREHQQGKVKTTAGRNPRLVWFSQVADRASALSEETRLTKFIADGNQRALTRMIISFEDLIAALDQGR